MFYAIWKGPWRPVQVYAVDAVNNKFLVSNGNNFVWVDMDEFVPVD